MVAEALKKKLMKRSSFEQTSNVKPNSRFKAYKHLFENLLKTSNISSNNPIVGAMILYDSSRVMSVTKASD